VASHKEQDLEHERILDHYLRYSNLEKKEELEKTLLRGVDIWLTPEEAIGYGLADAVEPKDAHYPGNMFAEHFVQPVPVDCLAWFH
jgi:ATP-dependent protease ClpP protease subunit